MRDLFFAMYGYSGIEWTIWCLVFLLIGVVLLIISLVKLKKKTKIAGIILSVLLIWQIMPVGFWWMAWSSIPCRACAIQNGFAMNYQKFEKYMNIAANTSLIPWQKGAYYGLIASEMNINHQGPKAIEYYDKAYKYIKSYKYKQVWATAFLIYYYAGDTEKALKIAEELEAYVFIARHYIIEQKYPEALNAANKSIKKAPDWFSCYLTRAYINMVLGNKSEELADYQKALSLAKDEKQKQSIREYKQLRDKQLEIKKRNAVDMGFVKE